MADRFPNGTEQRAGIELRAAGRTLTGYAATFDTPTRIADFTEVIRSGAFRGSLARGTDILALTDHDPSKLLARTKSGTLRLSEDTRGLAFELSVPSTSLGNDILAMVARGDIGGMSFSFRATDEHWTDKNTRELRAVDLLEISVVHAHPAYTGTQIAVRSRPMNDDDMKQRIRRLMVELT